MSDARTHLSTVAQDPEAIWQLQQLGLMFAARCLYFSPAAKLDSQITPKDVFNSAMVRVVNGTVSWDKERYPQFQSFFEAVILSVVSALSKDNRSKRDSSGSPPNASLQ